MWILTLGRAEGTPLPPLPIPSIEDGLLRCKQLTLLLDWAEQFEAESCQSGDAVAFSVLLGDLNFDNCSKGEELSGGGEAQRPGPPTERWSSVQITHKSRGTNSSAVSGTPAG